MRKSLIFYAYVLCSGLCASVSRFEHRVVKWKESTKKRHQLKSPDPIWEHCKAQERRTEELILKSVVFFCPSVSLEIAWYTGYYLVMLVLPLLNEPSFLSYSVHMYVAWKLALQENRETDLLQKSWSNRTWEKIILQQYSEWLASMTLSEIQNRCQIYKRLEYKVAAIGSTSFSTPDKSEVELCSAQTVKSSAIARWNYPC